MGCTHSAVRQGPVFLFWSDVSLKRYSHLSIYLLLVPPPLAASRGSHPAAATFNTSPPPPPQSHPSSLRAGVQFTVERPARLFYEVGMPAEESATEVAPPPLPWPCKWCRRNKRVQRSRLFTYWERNSRQLTIPRRPLCSTPDLPPRPPPGGSSERRVPSDSNEETRRLNNRHFQNFQRATGEGAPPRFT